jgi:hypothetical protein
VIVLELNDLLDQAFNPGNGDEDDNDEDYEDVVELSPEDENKIDNVRCFLVTR